MHCLRLETWKYFVSWQFPFLTFAEYAQVTKMLGNGRLEALCFDGVNRLCHIRGKLRKKVRVLIVADWTAINELQKLCFPLWALICYHGNNGYCEAWLQASIHVLSALLLLYIVLDMIARWVCHATMLNLWEFSRLSSHWVPVRFCLNFAN